jgi:hypothetical protein
LIIFPPHLVITTPKKFRAALNKFTFLTLRTHYANHIKYFFNEIAPSTFILEENTVTMPWYVKLPRYAPYTRAFKKIINLLPSSGLIQKWHAGFWGTLRDKKRYVETFQPQVLTVHDLRLGFLAFLICAAISLVVFLMEMGLRRVSSRN